MEAVAEKKDLKELVIIEQTNALQIFLTDRGLDPVLEKLKEQIDGFVPDVTTKKGRDEIASLAFKVAKSKTYLDSVGKKLVDELKKQPKLIDNERSRVWDILEKWQADVRRPLTEWENAEKARVSALQERMNTFDHYVNDKAMVTSEQIQYAIDILKALVIDDSWEEYKQEAEFKRADSLMKLNDMLVSTKKREEDAAELEKLRAAEQIRVKQEQEEALRREGEERAKREAEAKAQAEREAAEEAAKKEREAAALKQLELQLAAEKAEREKRDAIAAAQHAEQEKLAAVARAEQAEKDAKATAEKEAAEKVAAEQAAIEKREANKRHCAKINNAAMQCLIDNGIEAAIAKNVITLIASKKVTNVTISY